MKKLLSSQDMICQQCEEGREIKAKGMCMACYMQKRRSNQKGHDARRVNGEGIGVLMSLPDQGWRDRIYSMIDTSGGLDACHEWMGSRNAGGYGVMTIKGIPVSAHRAIHAICSDDFFCEVVMHKCDNPSCCNPQHLRSGTYQENMDDMWAKGRGFRGSRMGGQEKTP